MAVSYIPLRAIRLCICPKKLIDSSSRITPPSSPLLSQNTAVNTFSTVSASQPTAPRDITTSPNLMTQAGLDNTVLDTVFVTSPTNMTSTSNKSSTPLMSLASQASESFRTSPAPLSQSQVLAVQQTDTPSSASIPTTLYSSTASPVVVLSITTVVVFQPTVIRSPYTPTSPPTSSSTSSSPPSATSTCTVGCEGWACSTDSQCVEPWRCVNGGCH